MAVKRCYKCGANVPDGAEFCPSCGAPKGARAAEQPSQPMYQQQPVMRSTPMSMQKVSPLAGIFDMVFSKTGIIFAIALGVLFAWIGILIGVFSPENGDFAVMLNTMGFAAIGLFVCAGGIWNNRIDKYSRAGMVLIGGFVIAMGLSLLSRFGNLT